MTAVERIKAASETVQTELGSVGAQLEEATRLIGRERDLTAIRLIGMDGEGAEYHRLADELRPLATRVAWFETVVQQILDHVIEVPAMARLPHALAHFAKMGVDLSRFHGDLAQLEIDIGNCRSAAHKGLSAGARSTKPIVQALVDATQHSTTARTLSGSRSSWPTRPSRPEPEPPGSPAGTETGQLFRVTKTFAWTPAFPTCRLPGRPR